MTQIESPKHYDLEERTLAFSKNVRAFIYEIPKTISNIEDGKQVVRSSGSVGANYIEANEALSKKDFLMRIKICRKEAKETSYWLTLINTGNNVILSEARDALLKESKELTMIFGAIMRKSEQTNN